MEHVHLCLSGLIDQDLSAYEYYHSLSGEIQSELQNREISTMGELQDAAARIKARRKRGGAYV